ncbi:hypothetical protein RND71_009295 [Anisodus tanguticus]|uniref:Uncharacterized protein n=1 Tax=Anisodus tanguticus TaxID=243964 RepID=A0AAE1VRP5_9SOLA|nr:hypothetical protein RND71_009295 [Anisodus tanguticus]
MEMIKAKAQKEKNEAYRELRIFVERAGCLSLHSANDFSVTGFYALQHIFFFSSFNASAGALNAAGGAGGSGGGPCRGIVGFSVMPELKHKSEPHFLCHFGHAPRFSSGFCSHGMVGLSIYRTPLLLRTPNNPFVNSNGGSIINSLTVLYKQKLMEMNKAKSQKQKNEATEK